MDHVAIMKKSWGMIPKILSGEKTIESRWYKTERVPWGKIHSGDVVYFKNSGEPVTAKAKVCKVIKFESLTPEKIKEILEKYGRADGIERKMVPQYAKLFRDKKHCLLIFLKDSRKVKPFGVDKTGFGAMSAWVSIETIDQVVLST